MKINAEKSNYLVVGPTIFFYNYKDLQVKKEILHGINGEFRSGELTAIMGPSGAGKSTLLNILAGYTIKGSRGDICINGLSRTNSRMRHFLKMSCYIQQDDELRPLLTVREAMTFATHLKLGITTSICDKEKQIRYLLEMLGLTQHEKTLTKSLSGGQRKRLSIALELITNPPILFLDEPTTGLDSASTSSCVSLLKNLARQGRTVICTIHQPSALIFEMMDHLYAIADGKCLYQGTTPDLLPQLSSLGLICPPYHNPADFLIEVAAGEYGADSLMLAVEAAEKGRLDANPSVEEIPKEENGLSLRVLRAKKNSIDIVEYSSKLPKPAPVWYQSFYLFGRNCIIQRRDISNLLLRLGMHLLISVCFGAIYNHVGSNANSVFANYIFVYGTNLFLHYTGQMAVTINFPLEFKVLKREFFNRWYTLTPYCIATALFEIPFQIFCVLVYLVPSYLLTSQPLELTRFSYFLLFLVCVCLTAQALGFLVGATTPVTLAVFIGPTITVFLSVFGFASRYSDIPYLLRIFYHISYFRTSFQGSLHILYGLNRTYLPCLVNGFHGKTGYCHYRHPLKFLREMEFNELNVGFDIGYILSVGILVYACTITAVWFRLTSR